MQKQIQPALQETDKQKHQIEMACDDPEFNGKKPFDILMSDLEFNTTTTKAHSDMLHLIAQKND